MTCLQARNPIQNLVLEIMYFSMKNFQKKDYNVDV